MKHLGFSLLELLLVLVGIAAIASWTMHHYQIKQRRTQTLQIQSDIKTLQRALDSYFHITGCDQKGNFANSSSEVSCADLQKIDNQVMCARPPLVSQYTAQIILTDQVTADSQAKPIYKLKVQAKMNASFTADEIDWFNQELRGQTGALEDTLTWQSLPSNSYVQMGDESWVLNGASSFFRATENQRGSGGEPAPQYSGSFCAN